MATISADLFVRYVPGEPLDSAHNRLLFNQFGGTPTIPPMNAGDTLNLSVYLLDVGPGGAVPYKGHRYAGASVVVRLRAAGNNTVYATGTASAEITPATGTTRSIVQAFGSAQVEKQKVVFNSNPFTGSYKIGFPTPGGGGGAHVGPANSAAIPWNSNAAAILNEVLATRGYREGSSGGFSTYAELAAFYVSFYGSERGTRPILTGDATDLTNGFKLEYGSLYGGANYWSNMPLITIDDSDIQYQFGWTVSVPLTGGSFTDLFLAGNAPAYLEVLITPAGESQVYAAQYLLTSSGGVVGDPPPPVPGGGGPPGNVDGIVYDGDHFSAAWAVGVMRTETPFPEKPGYHIFKQRYRIARSSYADLPLDSPCPKDGNAFLVEETERQDVGGADLQEWDRIWAHVPPPIVDGEMVDYVWQTTGTIGGTGGTAAIQSIPLTRWAKRTRTFHHTSDPTTITKLRLPKAGVFAGVGLIFDGFVNLYGGAVTIARDDDVRRWMGNIWVKTHWEITI